MKRRIKLNIPDLMETVSGIVNLPDNMKYLMLLAHGAGAGMEHEFMEALSQELGSLAIGTVRFNFIYMEKGGRAPDRPPKAHQVLVAATERGKEYAGPLPLIAAGKSFGGRMFSQAAAKQLIPEVQGLIFYGFPLHAPGKPGVSRAEHLNMVKQPMLFLQGERDNLAAPELIREVSKSLRKGTLRMFDHADHSFKTLKKSGVTHQEMIARLAKESRAWLDNTFKG